MNNPLVSIIVLNWNGKELLQECLDSVLKSTYSPKETIVVDNGSSDGSVQLIKSNFQSVIVLETGENLGYGEGNNRGIAIAKGKYVVTLNNDVVVERCWLDKPIEYLENDIGIGVISCRQMNYYNRLLVDSCFHYPAPELTLARYGYGEIYKDDSRLSVPGYVIAPNGGSAIYRKEMFLKLCGFDRNFFAYNDETDLCMRAFLNGWKCVYVPQSIVYHKDSASFKKVGGKMHYFHERNRIWFIYKFYPVSFIISHTIPIVLEEMRTLRRDVIIQKAPTRYLKARIHGIAGIFRYSKERRKNVRMFLDRKNEFIAFQRKKMIPF